MSQPIVDITHREEFSAAHRLHCDALSAEENLALYGPCNTLHGHNYAVEATLRGPVDPQHGMVMNLADLMKVMREEIWEPCDHKYLNEDVPWLAGRVPTAEVLAIAFWERLAARADDLAPGRLVNVRVVESAANRVDYAGPGAS
jgi:6-pyruvoyltetrahydropterin/6-carboxytetrahydropterin synthase